MWDWKTERGKRIAPGRLRVKPFSPGSQSAAKSFIRSFICKLIRVQTQYDNDPFRTRHECWKVIRDWNKKTRDFLTKEMHGISVEFFDETYRSIGLVEKV